MRVFRRVFILALLPLFDSPKEISFQLPVARLSRTTPGIYNQVARWRDGPPVNPENLSHAALEPIPRHRLSDLPRSRNTQPAVGEIVFQEVKKKEASPDLLSQPVDFQELPPFAQALPSLKSLPGLNHSPTVSCAPYFAGASVPVCRSVSSSAP